MGHITRVGAILLILFISIQRCKLVGVALRGHSLDPSAYVIG